jgi:hypothetical protein
MPFHVCAAPQKASLTQHNPDVSLLPQIDFGSSDSDELQDTEDENGAGKSGIQMLLDLKQVSACSAS